MREIDTGRSPRLWGSRSFRWGAAVAGVLCVGLAGIFDLVYWHTSHLLIQNLDRSVLEQLSLLAARPPDLLPFMITSRMNGSPSIVTRVGLFGPDRTRIVGDIDEIPAGLTLDRQVRSVLAPGDPAVHWRASGGVLPGDRILIVAREEDQILDVQNSLIRAALLTILPTILVCLGCGVIVGIATERRLRQINEIAIRIISGHLNERLPERAHGDELDRLCAIVNRMLDRLEEGIDALQAVGENIAHDLRTPLTSLRARLERMSEASDPAAAVRLSVEGVDKALSIVTALLRISDIEHGKRAAGFAAVDLSELLFETAEAWRPVAEENGITFHCAASISVEIFGDRQLLIEAVVNLIDNALKFTPAGGQVSIAMEGTADRPIVIVSDNGPGIPVDARSSVFQRFYRGAASRSTGGSGLGLSMVAAVVRLHRFRIALSDNGPGCRFTLFCWRHEINKAQDETFWAFPANMDP